MTARIDIAALPMIAWSARSPSSPAPAARPVGLRGLTARCGQAKWLSVPLMPSSRSTKTEIHLHRNLIHKTSDTPAFGGALLSDYNFRGISQSNRGPSGTVYSETRFNATSNFQLYFGS